MNSLPITSDLTAQIDIECGNTAEGHRLPIAEKSDVHLPTSKQKASAAWQDTLWRCWPRKECWPAKMDVYEAAAYLRVSPDTIPRALVGARDGKAKLAHQRVGAVYRLRKVDLDAFGSVPVRK